MGQSAESREILNNDEKFRSWSLAGLAAATCIYLITLNLLAPSSLSGDWLLWLGILGSLVTTALVFSGHANDLVASSFVILITALTLFSQHTYSGLGPDNLIWQLAFASFALLFCGMRIGLILFAILITNLAYFLVAHPELATDRVWSSMPVVIGSVYGAIVTFAINMVYLIWQQSIRNAVLQSSKAKSEFLSGISHELRTPLNSIMGFADVLGHGYVGSLEGKQAEYVDNIALSSRHMLALVNDLLDISKIEAGESEFSPTSVNIGQVIQSCYQLFQEDAQRDQVYLEIDAADLNDLTAMVDEVKLRQILINLLANALKFSNAGGTVKLKGVIKDNMISISVTDNGHGVPKEFEDQIFERFFQVNTATDNKSPGTGLGLPISRHFAEMHGGTVYLDRSAIRTETRFVVEIPLRHVAEDSTDGQPAMAENL